MSPIPIYKPEQIRPFLSYGKRGNKNMQLVLQCYSRMEVVLHILLHTFKPVLQQISLLQA